MNTQQSDAGAWVFMCGYVLARAHARSRVFFVRVCVRGDERRVAGPSDPTVAAASRRCLSEQCSECDMVFYVKLRITHSYTSCIYECLDA